MTQEKVEWHMKYFEARPPGSRSLPSESLVRSCSIVSRKTFPHSAQPFPAPGGNNQTYLLFLDAASTTVKQAHNLAVTDRILCERLQYWDSYSCWYLILWSKKCLRNLESETEHRKEEPLNFSQSVISDLTFDFSALKLRWRTTTIRGWAKVFFVPLLQYRRRDSTQLVTQQKSQLVLSSAKYVGDFNQCVKKCSL